MTSVEKLANNPVLTIFARLAVGLMAIAFSGVLAFASAKFTKLDSVESRLNTIEAVTPYQQKDVKKLTDAVKDLSAYVQNLQISNSAILAKLDTLEKGQ